ncbi:MAG TPA: O-antigen ligase family protein [Planctomycetota bacterium]|nr:O-antigen ligase family protein [Planctomycetota bacterium]
MSLTAIAFVAAYFVLLGLAFVRHPIFGLFAYLFAFYNHPPARWWGKALPDLRWALVAAAVTLVAIVVTGRARGANGLAKASGKLILAYAAWMAIQLVWAVNRAGAVEGAVLFAKYVVLLVLVAKTVDTAERVDQFAWANIIGCFIFGWIAWRDPHLQHGRLEGVGGPGVNDSNTLGVHMIAGLALAGFVLLSTRSWIARGAALIACAFIMNTIVLTESRGALVGMAAAGLPALLLVPRRMRKVIVVLGGLAAVMLLVLAHDQFWERMQTIETYKQDASASSRFELVLPTWHMFADHPLGVGHEGFRALSPRYVPASILSNDGTRSPHTTILAVLAEQGVVGIVLYGLLYLAVLRELFRTRDLARERTDDPRLLFPIAAIGCGLTAFAVCGLTGNYLKCEAQIWLIGLLTAIHGLAEQAEGAPEEAAAGSAPAHLSPAAAGAAALAGPVHV